MNRFARYTLLSVAVATAAISAASPAAAGGGYRHHRHNNDAAALGLFGLAAGVVAGAAIASQPRYVEPDYLPPPPPPAYYPPRGNVYVTQYPPAPVSYAIEPWTPEWYDYCSARYRSFSPNDGTYIGYDGRAHFCVAG